MKIRLVSILTGSLLSGCAMFGVHNLPKEKTIELAPTRIGATQAVISYSNCGHCWTPTDDQSGRAGLVDQTMNVALQQAGLPPMLKPGQRNAPGIHIATRLSKDNTGSGTAILTIFTAFLFPVIIDTDYTLTTCLYENGVPKIARRNNAHSLVEHFNIWPILPIFLSPIPGLSTDTSAHYELAGRITAGEIIAAYADYTSQKPLNPALYGACK